MATDFMSIIDYCLQSEFLRAILFHIKCYTWCHAWYFNKVVAGYVFPIEKRDDVFHGNNISSIEIPVTAMTGDGVCMENHAMP